MRSVKQLSGLVALILTASCSFNMSTDGSAGGARQPQARRAPAPPPPPPARAAVAPAPVVPAPVAPAPATPIRRLGRAPAPVQTSAVAPNNVAALATDSINLSKVLEIRARSPKACGYIEVSQANWVHVDCQKYQAAAKAVPHLSVRKLRLVKAHKQRFLRFRSRSTTPTPRPVAVGAGPATAGPGQIAEGFPSTVDHRTDGTEGPIKNQGGVGSCTAHSLSSALDNAAIRAGNLKPGDRNGMTSPLHVWSRYGLPNMGAAADSNIAQPVGVYTTWPQSDREACMLFQGNGSYAADCAEAYNVKAGAWREDKPLMAKYDKSQAEGVYKISSIEKLQTDPPNMEEVLGILAGGADIWSAFLIDGYAWSNSKMKNAVIPDWSSPSGGHAVTISGYRETPSGKQFLIHNSWGESWGEKGYAWINEAMVVKHLYYAYKVKITNGVPKADLTDDDCAPDELVDATVGMCAIICDDDSRPNNGCKK